MDYVAVAKGIGTHKRLGQNFLVNTGIAKAEAEYARGRAALELGAGLGALTKELCAVAKRVVAVEYDKRLFDLLASTLSEKNLELVNADFFEPGTGKFEGAEIMVSNIPYNLSSKTLAWLGERDIPAVLCLQKEFVEHMLAEPGTGKYSRLSVVTKLRFSVHEIMDVPASMFYPRPRVDSKIIYIKPSGAGIDKKSLDTISLLMMHKKKKIRNAVIDSSAAMGMSKASAAKLADSLACKDMRAFQMEPDLLLKTAMKINERTEGTR